MNNNNLNKPNINNIRAVYESFPFPSGGTPNLVTHWTNLIKSYFDSRKIDLDGCNFLDAGCGTGDNVISFAETFPQIEFSACDLSDVSIQIAKETINKKSLKNIISCQQQDLMSFNSLVKYDFIASLGVLHHTPSPGLCLKNLMEALKPGGTIFIDLYGYYGHLKAELAQKIINILEPDFNLIENRLAAMEWITSTLFKTHLPPERSDPKFISMVDAYLTPIAYSYQILEAIKLLESYGVKGVVWWDAPKLLQQGLVFYTNFNGEKSGTLLPARWHNRLEKLNIEEQYRFYELLFTPFDFFLVGQK
jgi:SAM-dependent methyltransferase